MPDQFDKSINFSDWVRHLRFWLAKSNVPDRGEIKIEVMFPDARSQHHAISALKMELDPRTGPLSVVTMPVAGEVFEFEGVKIVFSNPDRWDRRA